MITMWTKQQIRLARKIELAPILAQRNYRLYPLENGNFRILHDDAAHGAGIVVKESFWTWNEKNMAGNTIDFFMKIEGKSFNQTMKIIMEGYSIAQKFTSPVALPSVTTTQAGTNYGSITGITRKSYSQN